MSDVDPHAAARAAHWRRQEILKRGEIVDALEQIAADFAAHRDHEGDLLANAFSELARALS